MFGSILALQIGILQKGSFIMEKIIALCLVLVLALSMVGCVENSEIPEVGATNNTTQNGSSTETATPGITTEETLSENNAQYGILQELVDTYGFPFYFRYTEGMGITRFEISENCAIRTWRHSMDGETEHTNLVWKVVDNTLEISGDWEEKFTVDMELGTATSQTDGKEYRISVNRKDGDGSQWYVEWVSDNEGGQ